MFINIWDKNNKAILVNDFEDRFFNYTTSNYCYFEYQSGENGGFGSFYDKISFSSSVDCFNYLISNTFRYLFESKDIKYIKIVENGKILFKYENRYVFD